MIPIDDTRTSGLSSPPGSVVSPPTLLALLLVALTSACVADLEELDSLLIPELSDMPRPELAGLSHHLLAVEAGEELRVVRVYPGARTLAPFGPPLPSVSATTHQVYEVWSNAERSRAIVYLWPLETGSGWVLAGDGERWWPLEEGKGVRAGYVVGMNNPPSPSLELVWLGRYREVDEEPEVSAIARRFDGALITELPWRPGVYPDDDGLPDRVVFGPSDEWFILERQSGATIFEVASSTEHALSSEPPGGATTSPWAPFATSVLRHRDEVGWFDPMGRPIDVPGLSGSARVGSSLAVDEGRLFRIEDRRVIELQPLGLHARDLIVGAGSGFAITSRPAGSWTTHRVGPLGFRELTYERPEASAPPPDFEPIPGTSIDSRRLVTVEDRAVLLMVIRFQTPRAGFEERAEVWITDSNGLDQTHRLISDPCCVPQIELDPEGRTAIWIKSGTLTGFEFETGEHFDLSFGLTWPKQVFGQPRG